MPSFSSSPVLLTGNAHPALVQAICDHLNIKLGAIQVGRFPDHEIKVKIGVNIRGEDVFIIQPTNATEQWGSDNLLELLIMIDAARRASAERITVVIPYFGYARQDRKDKPRVPISAKLVADMIGVAGADRFLTIDLHSGQIQGFTNLPFDHLYGRIVFLPEIAALNLEPLSIGSTDLGGAPVVGSWIKWIPGAKMVLMDKRRKGDRSVEIRQVMGEVEGRHIVLVDDELSTCETMVVASEAALDRGALSVRAVGTHGKFIEGGLEKLAASRIMEVFVTDTLPLPELPSNFKVCSVASLLGDAILDIHESKSLTRHFDLDPDKPNGVEA